MTPVPRRAFSMIEAAVSIVIVGVMLGAAIQTLGASRLGQAWNSERLRALALAQAMMGEVVDQYYKDPSAVSVLFGPELGEDQTVRTTLNDVDDFNGLDGPPTNRDGSAIPGLTNWRRTVTIDWVDPQAPSTTTLLESGLKRITVDIYRAQIKMAELTAFRSAAIPR